MPEHASPRATESSHIRDDLDEMLEEIREDPVARAGYEDARHREELLDALVTVRQSRTQKAVAAAMGTTQSAVSDIENGRVDPRLSTLQRYARAVDRRLEVALCSDGNAGASEDRAPELVKQATALAEECSLGGILTDLYWEEPKIGPQSPASVAERTGLPEATVEHTMYRLAKAQWLHVASPHRSRELHFSLSDERGLVLGMSLGSDHVDAVLTNLRTSRVLTQRQHPLPDTSPQNVVRTVVGLVQELQGEVGEGQEIVGLGVALAGLIDGDTGAVYFAPDLQTSAYGWNGVSLEADLEKAISLGISGHAHIRVAVENDANALGMHEYLRGEAGQTVAVVLMSESGEGIGGGLIINRAIMHGQGGISGEIGHVVVNPGGERCRCGLRGCLETVASTAAIVRNIKKTVSTPIEGLADASAVVQRGDRAAAEVFAAAGRALGQVLSTVTAVVGPRRLVIFGPSQLTQAAHEGSGHSRQQTQDPGVASASAFLNGVRSAHGDVLLGFNVDIVPRVLDHATLPKAAAATAVHYFLSRPRRWMPTITRPKVGSNEAAREGEYALQ